MLERRQFHRWNFCIPCSFSWNERTIRARVSNLSYGGLCISGANLIPPEGADISVTLQLSADYQCTLTAHVVHAVSEAYEQGAFGVEFDTPMEERTTKLIPIVDQLFEEDP